VRVILALVDRGPSSVSEVAEALGDLAIERPDDLDRHGVAVRPVMTSSGLCRFGLYASSACCQFPGGRHAPTAPRPRVCVRRVADVRVAMPASLAASRTWPSRTASARGLRVIRAAVCVQAAVLRLDLPDAPRSPRQPEALSRLLVEDEIRRRDPLIDAAPDHLFAQGTGAPRIPTPAAQEMNAISGPALPTRQPRPSRLVMSIGRLELWLSWSSRSDGRLVSAAYSRPAYYCLIGDVTSPDE